MRKCNVCGQQIDPERLEALPETQHCVQHSAYKAPLVLNVFGHKTAGTIMIVERNHSMGAENERIAWRGHRRAR